MRRLEEFSRPAIKAARQAEESLAAKFFRRVGNVVTPNRGILSSAGNSGVDAQLALGMNPGMPVSTTGLSLTRVVIPSLISLIASSGRAEI